MQWFRKVESIVCSVVIVNISKTALRVTPLVQYRQLLYIILTLETFNLRIHQTNENSLYFRVIIFKTFASSSSNFIRWTQSWKYNSGVLIPHPPHIDSNSYSRKVVTCLQLAACSNEIRLSNVDWFVHRKRIKPWFQKKLSE